MQKSVYKKVELNKLKKDELLKIAEFLGLRGTTKKEIVDVLAAVQYDDAKDYTNVLQHTLLLTKAKKCCMNVTFEPNDSLLIEKYGGARHITESEACALYEAGFIVGYADVGTHAFHWFSKEALA